MSVRTVHAAQMSGRDTPQGLRERGYYEDLRYFTGGIWLCSISGRSVSGAICDAEEE